MKSKIDQPVAELPVKDLARAIAFYRQKLGFSPSWTHGTLTGLTRDNVALFLRQVEGTVVPQTHWIFADDVDATFHEMQSAQVEILDPLSDKPWGLRQFSIRDLDGHVFHVHHDV